MNLEINYLRSSSAKLIAQNPSTITINRVLYTPDNAGGRQKEAEQILDPFAGRIVQGKFPYAPKQDEAGLQNKAKVMMIAPFDADIKADSFTEDYFIVNGCTYLINRVVPRKIHGHVYSQHAVLEEVV